MRGKRLSTGLNVVISFGLLAAIAISDCQCKQDAKYPEKFCRDSIDPGDIYSFQREQDNPTDSSLDLLTHAVSLLYDYNKDIWSNAEIALFGPNLEIFFWSGNRRNKFSMSIGNDGNIEIERTQLIVEERCDKLELSCLKKVTSQLRKSLRKVFNEAETLLNDQPDCVLRNARLLVEGPDVNVVLTAGNGKHKLRVHFTEFGDVINSSTDIDQRIDEAIPVTTIDSKHLQRSIVTFCFSSELKALVRAADELLRKETESVWRDAQIELVGLNVYVKFESGSRTTKYQVGRDADGTIYGRNIERSWYATFNSGSQYVVQRVKDLVQSVFDFLFGLIRLRLT